MLRGLGSIIYKESIHVVRDPRTLFLMLLIPGVQMTLFGYAIDLDVRHIPTVVYDLDHGPESRDLFDAFVNTKTFDIIGRVDSDEALASAITRGKAQAAIKAPPRFTDDIRNGRGAAFQVLIDGSNSTVAMQALNVANAIALRRSLTVVSDLVGGGMTAPPVEARPRVLFNPDMKTVNFMVPGLVGIVMQIVTMMLTAFAVVREKENGTLEQLMVTPVSGLGLMVGKLVPYAVIGAVETSMVVCIMRFVFGVAIAGNLLLLAGFSLIFLFTALGLGLMVSTLAANQIQAVQVAFAVMLPSVLLSGFVFPQESMPTPIYIIGQFIPVTYFIRILRGIIIRGAGFYDLWPQAAILAVFGFSLLAISTLRFQKTLK